MDVSDGYGIFERNKRVDYVDVAKWFAVFAVIYDHSQYYLAEIQYSNDYILSRIFVFSFYLQTFFVTAGIVGREEFTPGSWKAFLKKLFYAIALPYFAWSVILSDVWNCGLVKGILWGTQTSLGAAGTDSVLWFLPVLFCARVIYRLCIQIMYRLFRKESVPYLAACVLILSFCSEMLTGLGRNVLPWGLDIALMGAALILLGRLVKPVMEHIEQQSWAGKTALFGVLLVLAAGIAYWNVPYYTDPAGIVVYRRGVWMARGFYGWNWFVFVISSLVSCVCLLTGATLVSGFRFLSLLGRNTLGFMLLHGKLYPMTVHLIGSTMQGMPSIVRALTAAGLNVLFCLPVIWLINRFLPPLLGRSQSVASVK